MPPTSQGSYGLGLFSPAGCKAEAEMKTGNTFKSASHSYLGAVCFLVTFLSK